MMKKLDRAMLACIAGGEADEVVYAISGDGGYGGEYGSGGYESSYGDGGYASEYASGNYESNYGDGGYGGGVSASVGGFDGNGVGPTSCLPAPPPPPPLTEGLFGFTFMETATAATAATLLAGGIGQGVGASLAIEGAGGLAGVASMGAGAAGLMGSAAIGLMSSVIIGGGVGYISYQNSETVRTVADGVGAGFVDGIVDITKRGIGHFSGSTAGSNYEP
jgi:hypothetical protein